MRIQKLFGSELVFTFIALERDHRYENINIRTINKMHRQHTTALGPNSLSKKITF